MDSGWEEIAEALGWHGASLERLGGGCINESTLLVSSRRGRIFVKRNAVAKVAMFEAEAAALTELAATRTIRVPEVLGIGTAGPFAYLALEALDLRPARTDGEFREMGRRLARLHRVTSPNGQYGWHRDNVIGETPQPNGWLDSWPAFFAECRLGFQFELAAARGRVFREAERLIERIPSFFDGDEPPPSLLHGDWWSGNAAVTRDGGEPVIFDPATYYGDRETDLAFSRLFGGFGPAFYAGYEAEWPLPEGAEKRVELYNLYHVLNHGHLFGGGYDAQAQGMIEQLLR
ncbi:MAG: fructosamine kinase family protein [Verrucomicrobiae bacterium]|nr:fructosamine kinase family protein [Verrucomicrobiae bacterium]